MMTQYARTIYLDGDVKWIALDNHLDYLCQHPDKEVAHVGEQLKELLNENTHNEQISGNFIDDDGNYNIWIKE